VLDEDAILLADSVDAILATACRREGITADALIVHPDRFETIDDARAWMRRFVHWHNHVHYHSGIGGHHPAAVHDHSALHTTRQRQAVLDAAYSANPARFRNRPPTASPPPTVAWINKPTIHTKPGQAPATTT